MSEAWIIAALIGVALIAAVLSFVAWYLLGRGPKPDERRFDSSDPGV